MSQFKVVNTSSPTVFGTECYEAGRDGYELVADELPADISNNPLVPIYYAKFIKYEEHDVALLKADVQLDKSITEFSPVNSLVVKKTGRPSKSSQLSK